MADGPGSSMKMMRTGSHGPFSLMTYDLNLKSNAMRFTQGKQQ